MKANLLLKNVLNPITVIRRTMLALVMVLTTSLAFSQTTLWDIIADSPDHNTLEAALIAAQLDGTLRSHSVTLTVFAPTDDAFAALPEGTVEALLADPFGALTDILKYHVVDGKALSTDLSDGQMITTLNGDSVAVKILDGSVYIDKALVTGPDLLAANGVVHVIDAVLLPVNTVWDIIMASPAHNTLEAAVKAAGLDGALSGDGPFTVFAPTDDAFAALPEGTIEALLADIPLLTRSSPITWWVPKHCLLTYQMVR